MGYMTLGKDQVQLIEGWHNEGHTYEQCAVKLNNMGFRSLKGKPLTGTQVSQHMIAYGIRIKDTFVKVKTNSGTKSNVKNSKLNFLDEVENILTSNLPRQLKEKYIANISQQSNKGQE